MAGLQFTTNTIVGLAMLVVAIVFMVVFLCLKKNIDDGEDVAEQENPQVQADSDAQAVAQSADTSASIGAEVTDGAAEAVLKGKEQYHVCGGHGVVENAALLSFVRKAVVEVCLAVFFLEVGQRHRGYASADHDLNVMCRPLRHGVRLTGLAEQFLSGALWRQPARGVGETTAYAFLVAGKAQSVL